MLLLYLNNRFLNGDKELIVITFNEALRFGWQRLYGKTRTMMDDRGIFLQKKMLKKDEFIQISGKIKVNFQITLTLVSIQGQRKRKL